MKRLLILSFIVGAKYIFGQGYVAPSPDAMGHFRMAASAVNYYNGSISTTIPLVDLPSKELSTSVFLGYNGSGFKVHDVASSTGLGWNLFAGGVISRIVRGKPDDLTNGYCASYPSTDTEPDLFFFSYMGQSVKFFIDAAGFAYTIPYSALKIKPGICAYGGNGVWEITDVNGIIYRFGKNSSDKETSTVKKVVDNSTLYTYVSSWYLSEIESPNLTDKITFSYTTANISYKNFYYTKYEQCNEDLNLKNESTIVYSNPKLVSLISTKQSNAYLFWQTGREDLSGGYYLDNIVVYAGSQQIKKYRFQYGYFQSNGCSTEYCKRLRLDKIYDLAPDPIHSFLYDTNLNLPSRESKNFDHWGYYNIGNGVDSWLQGGPIPSQYVGASRESDGNSLANLMKSITSRGGGVQEFEYETHLNGTTSVIVGGARIKRIINKDGQGNTIVKEITYGGSGILFYKPSSYIFSLLVGGVTKSIKRFSSSVFQLFDLAGYHIGYSTVEESIQGVGKTVYRFSNYDVHPDEGVSMLPPYSVTYKGWERGNLESVEIYNGTILLKRNIFEYEYNGSTKRTISGSIGFEMSYNCNGSGSYWESSPYSLISKAFTMKKQTTETYEPSGSGKKRVTIQEIEHDPITFIPIKTISYDNALPNSKYISLTKYVGNADYNFTDFPGINCQTQYNDCSASCANEPDPQVRAYCYSDCQTQLDNCTDQDPIYASPEVEAIRILRTRNQIVTPVEQINWIQQGSNTTVLSSNLNIYQKNGPSNSLITLKESYGISQPISESSFVQSKALTDGTFQKDNRMRNLILFDSYDQTTANLLQQTSFGGIQTNYTWDATNSLILATTTTGGVNTRTSSATYKPLVGKTTTTDPNGLVTNYEYDVYNRLNMVKDENGKALQHYRYHYKNETPGFRISPSRTEAIINETLNFSVIDIAASTGGTPTFLWDFGDGTVNDNNSTYVSHSYSSPGTYTVKLVGMNPVYGPVTRTIQVSVYYLPSLTNCEDGPVNIDYCGIQTPYFGACTVNNIYQYSPVDITASVSNGCPSTYTYYWEYRNVASGSWMSLNNNTATVTFYPPMIEGTYQIRCTVTDGCSNTTESLSEVVVYKSDSNCQGGQQ